MTSKIFGKFLVTISKFAAKMPNALLQFAEGVRRWEDRPHAYVPAGLRMRRINFPFPDNLRAGAEGAALGVAAEAAKAVVRTGYHAITSAFGETTPEQERTRPVSLPISQTRSGKRYRGSEEHSENPRSSKRLFQGMFIIQKDGQS